MWTEPMPARDAIPCILIILSPFITFGTPYLIGWYIILFVPYTY